MFVYVFCHILSVYLCECECVCECEGERERERECERECECECECECERECECEYEYEYEHPFYVRELRIADMDDFTLLSPMIQANSSQNYSKKYIPFKVDTDVLRKYSGTSKAGHITAIHLLLPLAPITDQLKNWQKSC